LTERQRACLRLVAEGRTSKEIARELAISPSTVDNHINTAMRLTGCANRLEAARLVQRSTRASPAHVPSGLDGPQSPLQPHPWVGLPPLGGRLNQASVIGRFLMILQIMVLGLIVGVGIIISILGVVRLLAG
jgi:DNA-binding CsgD family transcriptional regulator